jgi:hypothetical protein
VFASRNGVTYASRELVDADRLVKLERRGIAFDRILTVHEVLPA